MPSPGHQWIAANTCSEFVGALKRSGCKQCKAYSSIDYIISEDTVLQPDISIVCGKTKKKFPDFPPALVVGLLSPTTALRDRHIKFKIYEQQGIRYYLLVNTDAETVEIFQLVNGVYEIVPFDEKMPFTFLPGEGCSIEVGLQEIWQ